MRKISIIVIIIFLIGMVGTGHAAENNTTDNPDALAKATYEAGQIGRSMQVIKIIEDNGGIDPYRIEMFHSFDLSKWNGNELQIFEEIIKPADLKKLDDKRKESELIIADIDTRAKIKIAAYLITICIMAIIAVYMIFINKNSRL